MHQAKAKPRKRRHHYVPQSYLNGFETEKGSSQVWVLPKSEKKPYRSSVVNAAVERDYYAHESGELDADFVEDSFAEIEDAAKPVIKKISLGEVPNPEDRENLSALMAAQIVRVPSYRRGIENFLRSMLKKTAKVLHDSKSSIEETFQSIESRTGENLRGDPYVAKAIEEIRKGNFNIELAPWASMQAFSIMPTVLDYIYRMHWSFLLAKDDVPFITSDNPVVYYDYSEYQHNYGIGLGSKTVCLQFPISKSCILSASWNEQEFGFIEASRNHVRGLNEITIIHAEDYVFASTLYNDLARTVHEYRNHHVYTQCEEIEDMILCRRTLYTRG